MNAQGDSLFNKLLQKVHPQYGVTGLRVKNSCPPNATCKSMTCGHLKSFSKTTKMNRSIQQVSCSLLLTFPSAETDVPPLRARAPFSFFFSARALVGHSSQARHSFVPGKRSQGAETVYRFYRGSEYMCAASWVSRWLFSPPNLATTNLVKRAPAKRHHSGGCYSCCF